MWAIKIKKTEAAFAVCIYELKSIFVYVLKNTQILVNCSFVKVLKTPVPHSALQLQQIS